MDPPSCGGGWGEEGRSYSGLDSVRCQGCLGNALQTSQALVAWNQPVLTWVVPERGLDGLCCGRTLTVRNGAGWRSRKVQGSLLGPILHLSEGSAQALLWVAPGSRQMCSSCQRLCLSGPLGNIVIHLFPPVSLQAITVLLNARLLHSCSFSLHHSVCFLLILLSNHNPSELLDRGRRGRRETWG